MRMGHQFHAFWNKSIAHRMILYFSCFGTLLLIVLGLVNYYKSSHSLESEIIYYTTKIMEQTNANLDFYLNDAKTPIVLLSTNSSLIASLHNYQNMSWEEKLTNNRNIEELTFNINTFKTYIDDILIVGNNGYVNNLYSRQYVNMDYAFTEQKWIKEALNWNKSELNIIGMHTRDYYTAMDMRQNSKTVSVSLPIFDEKNQSIGVVICDLNLDKIGSTLPVQKIADKQKLFILDAQGEILFEQNKDKLGQRYSEAIYSSIEHRTAGQLFKTVDNEQNLILFTTSEMTGWKIVSEIPMNMIYHQADKLKTTAYVSIVFAILTIIVISTWISFQIRKPFKQLISRMKQVEAGDFSPKVLPYGYGEVQILGDKFENMVAEINVLILENYASRLTQQESEFKALQAQIKPHFLFNTLQLIQTEIACGNYEESSEILVALSDLFRYPMDLSRQVVFLKEEIYYIECYLSIYARKFEGRLQTQVHLDPALEDYQVPKLILQPIVENCILHGLDNMLSSGKISVECLKQEEVVVIRVTDNGKGIEAGRLLQLRDEINLHSSGGDNIGLRNVQQRIRMKYGDSYGLQISSFAQQGTIVEIRLPAEVIR
jgi:two-component system sensor histidine kinase YesM